MGQSMSTVCMLVKRDYVNVMLTTVVNFSMGPGIPVLEQLGMGKIVSTPQKRKRKRGEDQSVDEKPAPKKVASAKKTTTLTAQTKKAAVPGVESSPPVAKSKSSTTKAATKPAPKKPRVKKENHPESPPYASSSIQRETQTSGMPTHRYLT